MQRRGLIGFLFLWLYAAGFVGSLQAQQRCGLAKDLVVHALENMTPASTTDELRDAELLLKRANAVCAEQGDAWYYRALLDGRANRKDLAESERRRAGVFSSEALKEQLDPFTLAAPKGVPQAPSGRVRQKWALVVGISQFKDKTVEPLQFTRDDARSFADVLLDPKAGQFPKDNVHVLLDDNATTRNLKVELNWLARSAAPDDLVVIYIATHGTSRSMDTAGANYVLTYDTEVGEEQNPDLLFATAFPMVDISSVVASRIRATRVAIFLDTCFSEGAMTEQAGAGQRRIAPGLTSASVSEQTLNHIRQGTGRMIVAASRNDQESMESNRLRHGYFTYYLVEALRQQGGAEPLSQVYAYVQQHVSTEVAKDYKAYGWHQDPVMSRSEPDTDFALGERPAVVAGPGIQHSHGPA